MRRQNKTLQKQDSNCPLAYNPANKMIAGKNMPKPAPKLSRKPESNLRWSALIAVLLTFFVSPLAAIDLDQLTRTEIKDGWGQLILCQRIYQLQEVKPRLYEFDTAQCNTATKLVADLVSKYPANDQQRLKSQAEQHARNLSYNASEPYKSVRACREYCQRLVDLHNERKKEKAQSNDE